jgi:dihydrofolate reductase
LSDALRLNSGASEVMVIGGAELYAAALPRAERIHATEIDAVFDTDTRFPDLDPAAWREVSRERRQSDQANPFAMDFVIYQRTSGSPIPGS